MLKVAFIGDVLFPIPDIKGGAISTLVTGTPNWILLYFQQTVMACWNVIISIALQSFTGSESRIS